MLSEQLATARRLELTDAAELGDRVEGLFRGVKITLEDHGLERTLRLAVDRRVRWVSITTRSKELNDPDLVVTRDAAFDATVTALAESGAEPFVRKVFEQAELRAATQEFFRKFPLATFRGATLTVPHVGATHPETSAALQAGATLVLMLRAAIDLTPRMPAEPAPVLQTQVTPVESKGGRGLVREEDEGAAALLQPTGARSLDVAYFIAGSSALCTVMALALFPGAWPAITLIDSVVLLYLWRARRPP